MKRTLIFALFLAFTLIPKASFGATEADFSAVPGCLPGYAYSSLSGLPCQVSLVEQIQILNAKIADLEAKLRIAQAKLGDITTDSTCSPTIRAVADTNSISVVNNPVPVAFRVHITSNCQIDGKNLVVKVSKNGGDNLVANTIALQGSLKEGSLWNTDLTYNQRFAREDADYKYSFIFEGIQSRASVEVKKGFPAFQF